MACNKLSKSRLRLHCRFSHVRVARDVSNSQVKILEGLRDGPYDRLGFARFGYLLFGLNLHSTFHRTMPACHDRSCTCLWNIGSWLHQGVLLQSARDSTCRWEGFRWCPIRPQTSTCQRRDGACSSIKRVRDPKLSLPAKPRHHRGVGCTIHNQRPGSHCLVGKGAAGPARFAPPPPPPSCSTSVPRAKRSFT